MYRIVVIELYIIFCDGTVHNRIIANYFIVPFTKMLVVILVIAMPIAVHKMMYAEIIHKHILPHVISLHIRIVSRQ